MALATSSIPPAFLGFAEVYGESAPEDAVLRACNELRATANECTPPIGLRRLLRVFDARLVERPLKSAGRLEVDNNGYVVAVKKGAAWRRQRFSIAHEIGHMLILEALADQPRQLRELRKDENWAYLERLCNLAAAEILIPRDDFASFAPRLDSPRDFRNLYDRYLCSFSAMLIRFVEIFEGMSVSIWREYARHAAEQKDWRVIRCFNSSDNMWMPKGMTAGKHLMPNIVRMAASDGVARERDLLFELSSRKRNVCGITATLAPRRMHKTEPLPMFGGIEIQDEPLADSVVVLLMWPRACLESTCKSFAPLVNGIQGQRSDRDKMMRT